MFLPYSADEPLSDQVSLLAEGCHVHVEGGDTSRSDERSTTICWAVREGSDIGRSSKKESTASASVVASPRATRSRDSPPRMHIQTSAVSQGRRDRRGRC